MKGDFTRSTFKKGNHYSSVRMQQGRVQLDADWNEQSDILSHQIETGTGDTVGCCGGPLHHAGFNLITNLSGTPGHGGTLSLEETQYPENEHPPQISAGGFLISGGRYYVDGILCSNDRIVPFGSQPDLPQNAAVVRMENGTCITLYSKTGDPASGPPPDGKYLVYLDVWQRHITVLEDEAIREKALGGPDTATRLKTVWQAKILRVGEISDNTHCLDLPGWDSITHKPDGMLAAKTDDSQVEDKPCVLSPEGGYRRLENQLYRVEVHKRGDLGTATFKWSRDNGTVVAKWEHKDVNKLTVSSSGRDDVLNFAGGQWVELTDNNRELMGKSGILVQLTKVDGRYLTIDPTTAIYPDDLGTIDINHFTETPKVRRWDSDGVVTPTNENWIHLEDGVMVKFSDGDYRVGDYWLIPARTTEADVEWPMDTEATPPSPLWQLPHGIDHHYCKLGILEFSGGKWNNVGDCRYLFPPATQLTQLFYAGGDGQEAMPGQYLPQFLQVGVSNGRWPVFYNGNGVLPKYAVQFRITGCGSGQLAPSPAAVADNDVLSNTGSQIIVKTNDRGIAECRWLLDSNLVCLSQQVEAILLDTGGENVHLPILFNANLSVAGQVYYQPADCQGMLDNNVDTTVKDALDHIIKLTSINYVAGDGQDVIPGQECPKRIKVSVTNDCGPVEGAKVKFTAEPGGRVTGESGNIATAGDSYIATADSHGIALCRWMPNNDPSRSTQLLTAYLDDSKGNPHQQPDTIAFTANLIPKQSGTSTTGGCMVTVGENGQFITLEETFRVLIEKGIDSICICLMSGTYDVREDIRTDKRPLETIKIMGCGSRIMVNTKDIYLLAEEIVFTDLHFTRGTEDARVRLKGNRISVERCTFTSTMNPDRPFLVAFNYNRLETAVLQFQNNRVISRSEGYWEYIKPPAEIFQKFPIDVQTNFNAFSAVDPYTDPTVFKDASAEFADIVAKVDYNLRKVWFEARPLERIRQLDENKAGMVNQFYENINKDSVSPGTIIEIIYALVSIFEGGGYGYAMAVVPGVGGHISNNQIEGYLALNYDVGFEPLVLLSVNDDLKKMMGEWIARINVTESGPETLLLHGNRLVAVFTGGQNLMNIIRIYTKTKELPSALSVQRCIRSISVVDNIISSLGSSFVADTVIMNGNIFTQQCLNEAGCLVANVFGKRGIFTANSAEGNQNYIRTVLETGQLKEAANLIQIT